jgi:hypothetical protein
MYDDRLQMSRKSLFLVSGEVFNSFFGLSYIWPTLSKPKTKNSANLILVAECDGNQKQRE